VGVNEIVTPFLVVIIPNISWDEFLLYYDRLECAEMSKDSRGKKKNKNKKRPTRRIWLQPDHPAVAEQTGGAGPLRLQSSVYGHGRPATGVWHSRPVQS
jgi:hypothetical protein